MKKSMERGGSRLSFWGFGFRVIFNGSRALRAQHKASRIPSVIHCLGRLNPAQCYSKNDSSPELPAC